MEEIDIVDRLVDSEEHAGEGAVPDVAYDAQDEIIRLRKLLAEKEEKINILKEDLNLFVGYRKDLVADNWFSHKIFDEIQERMSA